MGKTSLETSSFGGMGMGEMGGFESLEEEKAQVVTKMEDLMNMDPAIMQSSDS